MVGKIFAVRSSTMPMKRRSHERRRNGKTDKSLADTGKVREKKNAIIFFLLSFSVIPNIGWQMVFIIGHSYIWLGKRKDACIQYMGVCCSPSAHGSYDILIWFSFVALCVCVCGGASGILAHSYVIADRASQGKARQTVTKWYEKCTADHFFDDGKLNETRCIASSAPQFDKNNFSFLSIFMSHNHWTMHGNSLCDACIRWLWLQLLVRSMLSIVLMRVFLVVSIVLDAASVGSEWTAIHTFDWNNDLFCLFDRYSQYVNGLELIRCRWWWLFDEIAVIAKWVPQRTCIVFFSRRCGDECPRVGKQTHAHAVQLRPISISKRQSLWSDNWRSAKKFWIQSRQTLRHQYGLWLWHEWNALFRLIRTTSR